MNIIDTLCVERAFYTRSSVVYFSWLTYKAKVVTKTLLTQSIILDQLLEVCESCFRQLSENGERCGDMGMKDEKRRWWNAPRAAPINYPKNNCFMDYSEIFNGI